LDCPKTAIKKFVGSLSTSSLYHISKESKDSFLGKANTKIVRDLEPLLGEPRRARRATKSMGGTVRRPRNGFRKIGKSGFGVFIQLRSNLFYQKFLKKSTRSAPPPAADDGGTASQKNFLNIFLILRAPIFLF